MPLNFLLPPRDFQGWLRRLFRQSRTINVQGRSIPRQRLRPDQLRLAGRYFLDSDLLNFGAGGGGDGAGAGADVDDGVVAVALSRNC